MDEFNLPKTGQIPEGYKLLANKQFETEWRSEHQKAVREIQPELNPEVTLAYLKKPIYSGHHLYEEKRGHIRKVGDSYEMLFNVAFRTIKGIKLEDIGLCAVEIYG